MQTENFKKQSYLRLWSYIRPYKTMLIIGIIAGFLTGGFLGASFFWLKGFVKPFEKTPPSIVKKVDGKIVPIDSSKSVSSDKSKKTGESQVDSIIYIASQWGIHLTDSQGNMTLFGVILFVSSFVLIWFLKNVAVYLNGFCMQWVGTKVITDMRDEIFSKILNQSLIFYSKAEVGQLISRCVEDTNQIQDGVSNNISDLTSCPFQVLGCVGYIAFVSITNQNYVMLFVLGFTGVAILFPIIIIGKKIRKIYTVAQQSVAEVMSRMHEVFTGIVQVKAYHTENYEHKKFNKINTGYCSNLIKAAKMALIISPTTEFLGICAMAVFFAYAFIDKVHLSDIITLAVPALMIYQPLKTVIRLNANIQRVMASADRYFNLVDTDVSLTEKSNPVLLPSFDNKIEFQDVSFSYDENQVPVLSNVSFTLNKGKTIAVVGETGSGKTTIANLLARFYDVTSGQVLIDGNDVRDIKIKDLREQIGIVTQNTILFNDTIANNIAYGRPDTPMEDIINAAKRANAHSFIVDGNHCGGYDTVVGEKGFILSGGEKQRIAIARAILRNPPILILDEATSALDTVTERLVQEAINNLMQNRTVFAIAHRLSTIKHADEILVMRKGEIAERGTHEELLGKEGGIYNKLHDIQFNG